jgi:hypothetical protein
VTTIDVEAREAKVKQMHRSVAEQPHGNYHVELGRSIAERLGFSPGTAARNPGCESFADIGYVFGLARQYDALQEAIRAAGHDHPDLAHPSPLHLPASPRCQHQVPGEEHRLLAVKSAD